MTVVVWIFALVTAVVHITAFAWETLLFQRAGVHQGVFAIPADDVPTCPTLGVQRRLLQPLHCRAASWSVSWPG